MEGGWSIQFGTQPLGQPMYELLLAAEAPNSHFELANFFLQRHLPQQGVNAALNLLVGGGLRRSQQS